MLGVHILPPFTSGKLDGHLAGTHTADTATDRQIDVWRWGGNALRCIAMSPFFRKLRLRRKESRSSVVVTLQLIHLVFG